MSKRSQNLARNAAWKAAKEQGKLRNGRLPVGSHHTLEAPRTSDEDVEEQLDDLEEP